MKINYNMIDLLVKNNNKGLAFATHNFSPSVLLSSVGPYAWSASPILEGTVAMRREQKKTRKSD